MNDNRSNYRYLFLLALVFLGAVGAFYPALSADFVNWDDQYNFLSNYDFRGLGWEQTKWAFSARRLGVYQPLAWLLLECEYALFGLNAQGYHAVSLLLHGINVALFYTLVRRIWLDLYGRNFTSEDMRAIDVASALVALFFGIHPLRVEVVAWVSCQPYLLSSLFVLASMLFYWRDLRRRGSETGTTYRGRRTALVLFIAACLSKAIAAFLPLIFAVAEWVLVRGPNRDRLWSSMRRLSPFFLVSVLTMSIAVWARTEIHQHPNTAYFAPWVRAFYSVFALGLYLEKSLIPFGLSNYYTRPLLTNYVAILRVAAVLFVIMLLLILPRRYPAVTVAVFCGIAALAANLGLKQIGSTVASDRYTYLATIMVVLVLVVGGGPIFSRPFLKSNPVLVSSGACAILAFLGGMSIAQTRHWQNSLSLWQRALAQGGDESEDVHNNFGLALLDARNYELADREFRRAIEINANYSLSYTNLGIVSIKRGQITEAKAAFEKALALDAQGVEALNGYAYASFLSSDFRTAEIYNQKALSLRSDDPSNWELRAQIKARQGDFDAAYSAVQQVLHLSPSSASGFNTLGVILFMRGDLTGAERAYRRALTINPGYVEAAANLADVSKSLQDRDK